MVCNWKASVLLAAALFVPAVAPLAAYAQEGPYFVVYDHHMQEPGTLEVSVSPVVGVPRAGHHFLGSLTEFEYGLKGWWTTEFYLDAQSTSGDSTFFTGYRFENRFRPLMRQHWINPVLYIEFENLNAADKTLKDIVGFDSTADAATPNAEARREHLREIETKLILSSDFRGWNFAENFIAEKKLTGNPWEFGYALGLNRPLGLKARPEECSFCPENIRLGLELYGGLGTWHRFTLSRTSHYLGPILAWELPSGVTVRVSPAFGLTPRSHRTLIRFGISYEFANLGERMRRFFR